MTKGKWKTRISQPGTMLEVVNEDRDYVCSLLGGGEHKQANAQAIAAVPDMIEALQDLIKAHDLKMGKSAIELRIELAKAALEKAGIK
jgi:hypothetical protein